MIVNDVLQQKVKLNIEIKDSKINKSISGQTDQVNYRFHAWFGIEFHFL